MTTFIFKEQEFIYDDGILYRKAFHHPFFKKGDWYPLNENKVNSCKYINISVNGEHYQLSRFIYKLHNPDWDINDTSDDNMIDHIDRNRTNNEISNLRVINRKLNCLNSNAKGVKYDKRSGKYEARIGINNKLITLKTCDTFEEAKKIYEAKKQDLINHIRTN